MEKECVFLRRLSAIPEVDILMPTDWLLINSMADNMNVSDVMVRYLVIREFYELSKNCDERKLLYAEKDHISYDIINDLGFPMMALYYKMQVKRAEYIKKIATIDTANAIYNFIDLIEKVDKYGFDMCYPLEINQNFCLLDGAHRLALALYHNIPKVKVFFNAGLNFTPNYALKWFQDMHMPEYIDIIVDVYRYILEEHGNTYVVCSQKDVDFGKYKETFFIKEMKTSCEDINNHFVLLSNCPLNNATRFYKLIPKFNNEKTVYPMYTEKVNLPSIQNETEEEVIKFCNSQGITLMKKNSGYVQK